MKIIQEWLIGLGNVKYLYICTLKELSYVKRKPSYQFIVKYVGESDHLLKLNPYQTFFVHLNILGSQFTLQDIQMIILSYITETKAECSVETYLYSTRLIVFIILNRYLNYFSR